MGQILNFMVAQTEPEEPCRLVRGVWEAATETLAFQEACILAVIGGAGTVCLQNRAFPLEAGTALAVLPWQLLRVAQVSAPLSYIRIHLSDALLLSAAGRWGDGTDWEKEVGNAPLSAWGQEGEALLQQLERECRESGMLSQVQRFGLLAQLWVLFVRSRCSLPPAPNPDETGVFHYLYLHCREKLTLTALSRLFYTSESTLSSYITGTTGLSFFDLLSELRVEKASSLLRYTDLTLEEVARLVGFQDASHLSKVYEARLDRRPGQERLRPDGLGEKERETACRLVELLLREYRNALSVQELAARVHCQPREVSPLLREVTGASCHELLQRLRAREAARLLLSTEQTLEEVAPEAGFGSVKSMTRSFLLLYGMTPGAFRIQGK